MAEQTRMAVSPHDVPEGDHDAALLLDFYIGEHEAFWKTADEPAANTTRPHWRASSLGKCLRSQCMERAGVPRDRAFTEQTKRTFQLGDDIHWFVRRRWARMGVLLDEEIEIVDADLHVSGHIDALVGGPVQEIPEKWRVYRNPDWIMFLEHLRSRVREETGGELPVIEYEIKSINNWSFRNLDGVRTDHACQAACYRILGERHPDALVMPAVRSELLYIPKDPMQFHRRGVPRSWDEEVLSRLETLNEAWDTGNWPPCTCGMTDDMAWEAKYCNYPNPDGDGCCGSTLLDVLERSVEASR